MRALTVEPHVAHSARLEEIPEPVPREGELLARTLAVGVCGTDLEIVNGDYGWAPPGAKRLVIGHESLAEVTWAPPGSGFAVGDRIAGIVRRPDPDPCACCAIGEWDMCRNGRYTERGIKERDGFASDRFAIETAFAVRVEASLGIAGVLMEPASVVAKAWDHIERIGRRATFEPRRALVTGAGPIGLLAALLGVQRGMEVHVLDRVSDGPKPALVRALGAVYHDGTVAEAGKNADVVIECTGVGQLVFEVMHLVAPDGIVCLTGVSSGGRSLNVDMGALNAELVLENNVVFGSVNANRRHYEAAARALAAADPAWLARLVSRQVPAADWAEALARRPDDVKPVIVFG